MASTEVADLLAQWEDRLRGLGAPCVEHLRPGLAPERVTALTAPLGLVLAEDAMALWTWHDGDRARYEDGRGSPSCTPSGRFLSLQDALDRSTRLRAITDTVRSWFVDDGPQPGEPPGQELYFRATYLIFAENEDPVYLDCTEPAAPTPTGVFMTHDIYRTPRVPLADRIRYRIDALERGLWRLDSEGGWMVDEGRAPDLPRWRDYYA